MLKEDELTRMEIWIKVTYQLQSSNRGRSSSCFVMKMMGMKPGQNVTKIDALMVVRVCVLLDLIKPCQMEGGVGSISIKADRWHKNTGWCQM